MDVSFPALSIFGNVELCKWIFHWKTSTILDPFSNVKTYPKLEQNIQKLLLLAQFTTSDFFLKNIRKFLRKFS